MASDEQSELPFWERKTLAEMSTAEWESLCDGCAKCCLNKLQDEDSGEIFYTSVACQKLDLNKCRCTVYENRFKHVADCVDLIREDVTALKWLPESCAYRRLSEGLGLPAWHPLVSGDQNSVHLAGMSVLGRVVSESDIDPDTIEDYVIEEFSTELRS